MSTDYDDQRQARRLPPSAATFGEQTVHEVLDSPLAIEELDALVSSPPDAPRPTAPITHSITRNN